MQLRCLATCRNSSDSFNLGCDIREGMMTYIQQHYPNAFPTTRFAARPDSEPSAAVLPPQLDNQPPKPAQ
jgi:hypothetical protein